MSGNDEDVRNRLNQRFDDKPEDDPEPEPEDDSEPQSEAQPDPDPEPQPEDDPEPEQKGPDFAADVTNVRETFDGISVYIPPDMHRAVDKEYQRLAYETEWDFQKNRHYQPLLLYYGLSVIESLEGDEVIEYLRRMDR